MNRNELYSGMRVIFNENAPFGGKLATIIDAIPSHNYDCLVEFDEFIGGHDGLGWGDVKGKNGHCYWCSASNFEEFIDVPEFIPETYNISYDDLL